MQTQALGAVSRGLELLAAPAHAAAGGGGRDSGSVWRAEPPGLLQADVREGGAEQAHSRTTVPGGGARGAGWVSGPAPGAVA